jgi:hypothetical protein
MIRTDPGLPFQERREAGIAMSNNRTRGSNLPEFPFEQMQDWSKTWIHERN